VSRRSILTLGLPLLSLGGLLLAAACSSDAQAVAEFHFDRPTDVAFGCIAFGKLPDGGIDTTTSVAVPTSECHSLTDAELDAGVQKTSALVGFTPQDTKGDVVVSRLGETSSSSVVGDSDPLTPRHNGLSVGTRPVSADTTPDGCFVVVANAGSCDLSEIDVFKASSAVRGPQYFQSKAATRNVVETASGTPLAASPAWVVAPPSNTERATCAATPSGFVYVAYPACHMVAAVDLADGRIKSTLNFAPGVAPTIGGGDVTCPQECKEVQGAVAGTFTDGVEPDAMAMDPAGGRLYVGARNESTVYIVGLDPSGIFASANSIPLEDAKGVLRLAASSDIEMGSDDPDTGAGQSGTHRFVYAVAADQSVRVVEVHPARLPVECDAQIDPRQLRAFTDVSKLPCFPVEPAATRTLQRRPKARGPGIRLPGDAVPYDVAFLTTRDKLTDLPVLTEPSAVRLNGTFAVVTGKSASLAGVAFYVNVDDEIYEDFISPGGPSTVDMSLALPHQLRDGLNDRRHAPPETCTDDAILLDRTKGPVRTLSDMTVLDGQTYNFNVAVKRQDYIEGATLPGRIAPITHQEVCTQTAPGGATTDHTVFQSTAFAPPPVRAKVFPDLESVPTETWVVTWEGPLAFTAFLQTHTGGIVRQVPGKLELTLDDSAGLFCDIGAEDRDIVHLTGCTVDADCGPSETCYLDPETPANQGGMCLERDRVDELAAPCKSLLISQRKYLIKPSGGADALGPARMTLMPKPSVLTTSPVGGCSSTLQCTALYEDEQKLLSETSGTPQPADKKYTCQPADELGPGNSCIAICPNNQDSECPVGSVCQDLRCVEGAFAPAACYAALQSYEVRAFQAYTVVGSVTGYLHDRVLDSGKCVSTGETLRVGRFHPVEPACGAADDASTLERPCSVTLDEPMGIRETDNTTKIGTRKSFGIRFRNYSFRIDFSDVMSLHPLPGVDEMGHVIPPNPLTQNVLEVSLPLGYRFIFVIGGGFIPRADALSNPDALLPSRVRLGPDGAIWIVDSGDADTQLGVRRGEMIRLKNVGVTAVVD
jgi:hypothetical protein